MEKHGRFVRMQNTMSADQWQEHVSRMAAIHDELVHNIPLKAKELEQILDKYDALNMIANYSLINVAYDPDTYKEWEHEGKSAHAEYIILMYLKHPYIPKEITPLGKEELGVVSDKVDEIFKDIFTMYATERADPKNPSPPNALQSLRFRTILYEIGVRNETYHHHEFDLLKGLFEPHDEWLKKNLGFCIEDALRITDAMGAINNHNLYKIIDESKLQAGQLLLEVKRFKKGLPHNTQYPESLLLKLSKKSGKDLTTYIDTAGGAYAFSNLATAWTCSPKEISEHSGIDKDRVQAFLNTFSTTFGSVKAEFAFPAATHILRTHPIITWDHQYMLPLCHLLIFAIRGMLETEIKKDPDYWQKYQSARATYLEKKAIEYLSNAIGTSQSYNNLRYPKKINGEDGEAELDGLIQYDNKLFLIECKAASMSLPARRGAPSLSEDLTRIVVDAHDQALCAREYVFSIKNPAFFLPDGQTLILDSTKIKNVYLITVCLDSLSVFTPVLHDVADLGIFHSNDLPWAVCLTDLRIISELCDIPCVFIHFLNRRLSSVQKINPSACDELDFLGYYFFEDLDLPSLTVENPDAKINLLSYTTPFDDYYLYEMGLRTTPAPKPSLNIPHTMRELIMCISDKENYGFSDEICKILDIDRGKWKQFNRQITKLFKKEHRKDASDAKESLLKAYLDFTP